MNDDLNVQQRVAAAVFEVCGSGAAAPWGVRAEDITRSQRRSRGWSFVRPVFDPSRRWRSLSTLRLSIVGLSLVLVVGLVVVVGSRSARNEQLGGAQYVLDYCPLSRSGLTCAASGTVHAGVVSEDARDLRLRIATLGDEEAVVTVRGDQIDVTSPPVVPLGELEAVIGKSDYLWFRRVLCLIAPYSHPSGTTTTSPSSPDDFSPPPPCPAVYATTTAIEDGTAWQGLGSYAAASNGVDTEAEDFANPDESMVLPMVGQGETGVRAEVGPLQATSAVAGHASTQSSSAGNVVVWSWSGSAGLNTWNKHVAAPDFMAMIASDLDGQIIHIAENMASSYSMSGAEINGLTTTQCHQVAAILDDGPLPTSLGLVSWSKQG
ncbi:MAG: hypothetical protein ACRD0Z_02530 [Acidimicrobiales bacterium]